MQPQKNLYIYLQLLLKYHFWLLYNVHLIDDQKTLRVSSNNKDLTRVNIV